MHHGILIGLLVLGPRLSHQGPTGESQRLPAKNGARKEQSSPEPEQN